MRHLAIPLLVCLLSLASRAAAQPASRPASRPVPDVVKRVESLYAEGAALFQANSYRAALNKFDAAYRLIPVANLHYNMGRCHEALGEVRAATKEYKSCMDHPECSGEAKLRSAEHYERLVKARVGAARSARPGTTPPVAREGERPEPAGPSATAIAKWTLLGLGVALAIGGGTAFGLGASDHNKIESVAHFNDANTILEMTRKEAQDLLDSGKTKKTVGVALLSVAGAALVTSAVLFFVPTKASTVEKRGGSSVRVVSEIGPNGGQLLLQGSF
jgi:tetratricopeptide (TPR) repeat protein